jgi:hypothetical protein
MQDAKPLDTLSFCRHLDILDGRWCTVFCGEQDYPHVSTKIIHPYKKIAIATWSYQSNGPTDVPVHELQWLYSSLLRLVREQGPPMLASEACHTHT